MFKKVILFSLCMAFSMLSSAQLTHGLRELGAPPTQEETNENNKQSLEYAQKIMQDVKEGKVVADEESPNKVATAYNQLAWYQILTADFKSAEKTIKAGMKLFPTYNYYPTNLAPSLLFQGKFKAAKAVYLEYKDKMLGERKYSEIFLADIAEIKATGLVNTKFEEDIQKIIELLK